jgi:hypothetical protein
MNFDTKGNNIILISYPPGGFGNFLYYVLTEFADDTVKISNNANFSFDKTGNSHLTIKYTRVYVHNSDYYNATLTQDADIFNKRVLVLADHGDNNTDHDYVKTKSFFPNAQILRVCVDQNTRHIVRHAIIEKGAGKNYEEENLKHAEQHWGKTLTDADLRENYTLMFHHHASDNIAQDLNQWNKVDCQNVINLCLADLIRDPVNCITDLIKQLKMQVVDSNRLKELCNQWQNKNKKYFSSFECWAQIQDSLNNNTNVSLSHVTSIYDQAYINYRLECLYNIVIPVYDYRHWFGDVFAINHMIDKLTTKIDVG